MTLVQEFLEQQADCVPDKIGLISGGQRLTYAQIESQANRLANALKEQGLARGERIVLYLPNSVELVIGIFAALKAGGVFVVVNYSTKYQKLVYILNNCQASALITSGRRVVLAEQLLPEVASLKALVFTANTVNKLVAPFHSWKNIQENYPDERPVKVNIDLDLACLVYTSGSTGEPKGVMEDHSNVVFVADSVISYLENVAADIIINVLPLSFDYGLYQLLMVFRFGGTLVLEKGFNYPAAILKQMVTEKVTGFPGVPTLFTLLVKMDLSQYDLSNLRYLTNTAAALPPSHIQQLREEFPGATLYSMYGLTETKRTLCLPPEQLDTRPGSVGIAMPDTEVWIEDDAGRRLGPGEVGELVVRGRHVMRGYWGNPAATKKRYRPAPIPGERVCYTDDLFRMDEEGFFYFVSRKDDMIKSRGEKIAPKEVENVLYGLPGVQAVAVIGVPDPILGEAIKAFLVVEGTGLSTARILAYCRAHLEDFMIPKYVVFRDALPQTSSGKIKKTGLA
ncbi:MAG: AMP-binding protein [Anaerolineae bacterium]|nr:AMP-binding protein [Anaerolineae bacterium]